MTTAIEVENLSAVHRLSIPLPEGGGVVVLRGGHGVGKSNTLKAVDALASGRNADKLQVRDGAARGEISGCGVRLTVGKRTNRSGELEVSSIEGRLSVAELVDPGLVDEGKADAKRIKALAQLAGVEADPKLFHELFDSPEEFDAVISADQLKTDDILLLADRIKRAIDAEARKVEGLANTERAHAAACAEAASGIDMDAVADADTLQSRLETAIRREQELQTKRREALARNKGIEEARAQLETAKQSDAGTCLEECRINEARARGEVAGTSAVVERLEKELAAASAQLKLDQSHYAKTQSELASAEQQALTVAAWEKTLAEAGAAAVPPTQDEIDDASIAVMSARKACDAGAVIRQARIKLVKKEDHLKAAAVHEKRAESLRGAAGNVDSVLSNQIAKLGCALKVEKGRLVTKTDRSTSELYSELSEGERYDIAIDIAVDAVGPKGLLTLPQTAWEGLNKKTKAGVANRCRLRGATLLTAEVTDDDILSAEVYDPERIINSTAELVTA